MLQLNHLEKRIIAQDIDCDYLLKQGEASFVILKFAEEKMPTIIAVGSQGRNCMYDVFIGSLTKSITKKSRIPVLVVSTHDAKTKYEE